MRILITRPKVREAELKQKLEEQGYVVESFPLQAKTFTFAAGTMGEC